MSLDPPSVEAYATIACPTPGFSCKGRPQRLPPVGRRRGTPCGPCQLQAVVGRRGDLGRCSHRKTVPFLDDAQPVMPILGVSRWICPDGSWADCKQPDHSHWGTGSWTWVDDGAPRRREALVGPRLKAAPRAGRRWRLDLTEQPRHSKARTLLSASPRGRSAWSSVAATTHAQH